MTFRIAKKNRGGSEILILGLRFDTYGPIHYFKDHQHSRNFCRYLFSLTGAHPTNGLTARNLACEFANGKMLKAAGLTAPRVQFDDFMGRRFPKEDGHDLLCDDGAYIGFAALSEEGHMTTNLATSRDGVPHVSLSTLQKYEGNKSDLRRVEAMLARKTSFTFFDQQQVACKNSLTVDAVIQQMVSRHLGGDVLLSVSHRDQLDHNQTYHLHRLMKRQG